jgi:hypothetical protein
LRLAELGARGAEALGGKPFERGHRAGDLDHLGKRAATMQRHVAARFDHHVGALGEGAAQRFHAEIVAHHQADQSDPISNHFAHYNGGRACRSPVVEGRQQHMGGHGQRRVAERAEWAEIGRFQLAFGDIDLGQGQVAVGLGAAMARHMLDHRQHAAGQTALHDGASERDHDLRIGGEGAVADNLMRALLRHIEYGQGVDRDAQVAELLRDQSGAREGAALRRLGIGLIQASVTTRRRHGAPKRRAQPLHAAPLLIDQHE